MTELEKKTSDIQELRDLLDTKISAARRQAADLRLEADVMVDIKRNLEKINEPTKP